MYKVEILWSTLSTTIKYGFKTEKEAHNWAYSQGDHAIDWNIVPEADGELLGV